MIVKTKDPRPTVNKFEQAGDAAEEQMTFYLRRAFGDCPDVFVFNDFRLVEGDDAAQLDHLILHTYGIFIIESKSVSGEVTVNEHDEWVRSWGNQRTGMPSPIQQAKRQGEFLRKLLVEHSEHLRDKYILGLFQGGFKHSPIGVCVAISDRGVINRRGTDPPELCKADRVCDRIKGEIERHRKASKLLGKADDEYGMYWFRLQEIERIKGFLLARHRPPVVPAALPTAPEAPPSATGEPVEDSLAKEGTTARPSSVPPMTSETAVCKHCGSGDLRATYGRYGYYFTCTTCGKNTPIDYTCRSCGAKGRIRKQGPRFDRVCGCGAVQLVWVNDPA